MSQLASEDKRTVLLQAGWCRYLTRSWAGCLGRNTFTLCQSLPSFHLHSNFYPLPHLKNHFLGSLEEVTTISPAFLRQFVLSVNDWERGCVGTDMKLAKYEKGRKNGYILNID